MRTTDPLKAVFDYIDRTVWIAHPTHGPYFEERTWLYYRVKEPVHRWCYRLGLTKDKPTSLYTAEDILKLLEP